MSQIKILRLTVSDFTDYDSRYCRNGGRYGFWTNYENYEGNDAYVVKEFTTGEFCPYCGSWDCSGDCTEPETAEKLPEYSPEQLQKLKQGEEVEWEIQLPEAVEQPLVCPVCMGRTKYFVRCNTIAEHLPLYCQRCKLSFDTSYRYGTQTSRYEGTTEDSFEPIKNLRTDGVI